jgi:predicted RNA-binding Zn-ribbon protein involved in translation (DUF1610 family)
MSLIKQTKEKQKGEQMRLRILGETKTKKEFTCPYCKEVAIEKGKVIEVIQDMNTGEQYATFPCKECKEQIMTK